MYTKDQLARAWELLEKRYEGSVDYLHFETFCRILDGIAKRDQRKSVFAPKSEQSQAPHEKVQ